MISKWTGRDQSLQRSDGGMLKIAADQFNAREVPGQGVQGSSLRLGSSKKNSLFRTEDKVKTDIGT
jgi:hypothetical protein